MPVNAEAATVMVPELAMPAPEQALDPLPAALLPVKVQLVIATLPELLFSMPPPAALAVTTLPVQAQLFSVRAPTL